MTSFPMSSGMDGSRPRLRCPRKHDASRRGWFKYYAGPVYVNAPGRCVRYGGVVSQPKGRGNLVFYRTFYSRWVACG